MTVVLGQRSQPEDQSQPSHNWGGVRRDLTWEMRRTQYRLSHTPTFPTWQPLPEASDVEVAVVGAPEPEPEPVRPGLVWLYAARLAHSHTDHSSVRRTGHGERLLLGECEGNDGTVRSMAVIGPATHLGRGEDEHYRRLHPALEPRYGRLRSGGNIMAARGSISKSDRETQFNPSYGMPAKILSGVQNLFGFGESNHLYPRIGASKRILVATMAAVLLIASAASTSLAGQQRYEVREGDTIESIAETFGVDPAAIRTSSYLPDGDFLTAGQVIVIPEPGQSPTDAAQMAAANEGASPWVATAYWVEWGDNPASIASQFGVSVDSLMEFNGIEDALELVPGTRLLIPDDATSVETNSAPADDDDGIVSFWVPEYKQQRNLSCEYAAAHIASTAWGWGPTEAEFMASIPQTLNPHYGYRGNIDGWWGNTDDYGIYAEPLVPVLNNWGFNAEVMYTQGDVDPLIAQLDAGHPVMVWLGFWGDTREVKTDDGTYSVFAGMHVVTVYGYDDEGIWVSDPAKGVKVHYSWDVFVDMWSVVDGMSLAVYPF